ncbi:MAG: SRPBCC family protein [bacterium]
MKWLFIIVGGLVGLVAIVALIGAMLPKGHVAKRSAKYKQSAEAIWTTITDFASAPSWRTELQSVAQLPDRNGHAVWLERSKHGPMPYEVTVIEPPQKMVTKIISDDLPFGGTWTYEIQDLEQTCVLTITEEGEIYNPIFRFLARFIFGYHATMESYLKALGKKFGEESVIILEG